MEGTRAALAAVAVTEPSLPRCSRPVLVGALRSATGSTRLGEFEYSQNRGASNRRPTNRFEARRSRNRHALPTLSDARSLVRGGLSPRSAAALGARGTVEG